MASTFYVTAQTEDVQEALRETSLSIPKISRKFLTIIGQKTSAVVKTGIRQTYSPPSKYYKRTGDFLRAWTYHARKDGSQVAVYPKVIYTTSDGQRKNRQWAAGLSSILNYGTKDGRIKPRSFIQRGETYVESGSYMPEVEKLIDREFEKYWGK